MRNFECVFIDRMVADLGYFCADPKLRVYWCKPGHTVGDGLVAIRLEKHANMINKAARDHKSLHIYIDHVNLLEKQKCAECIQPPDKLPAVLSPSKSQPKKKGKEIEEDVELNQGDSEADGEEEGGELQEESDEGDSDFVDSDYDLDDDEEHWKKNVDEDVDDDLVPKKTVHEEKLPDIDVAEENKMEAPDGTGSELTYKWKAFNKQTDMANPVFKLGMVFSTVNEVRDAISMYCVKNRVQLKKKRNNSVRVDAICAVGCTWNFVATKDSRTGCFVVSKFVDVHTCERVWKVNELTTPLLAKEFLQEFRDDVNMSLSAFANKVRRKFNMVPNRFKLARAKLACLKKIRGDEVAQYGMLWDYAQEVRTQNPNSKFILKTIGPVFSALYMCVDACKRGWLKGCRPLICLDGTHIKTKFGGQLLTAVGIDGNDCIYPIAWAVVEVECKSSWCWFLSTLKNDLNIINTSPFTIMSDKQKVMLMK